MRKPRLLEIRDVPLMAVEPPADESIIYAYVPKRKEEKIEED